MKKWWYFSWHWRNENEKPNPGGGTQLGSMWKHGKAWLNYQRSTRRTITLEWVLWTRDFWHVYISCSENDEQVSCSIGCGLFAVWICLGNIIPRTWLPRQKRNSALEEGRTYEPIQNREIGLRFRAGVLYINLWADPTSWSSKDPWWWDFSIDIPRLLFGKDKYENTTVADKMLVLPLPEQCYLICCEIQLCVWKRPRWFAKRRVYGKITCPNGVPMPDKRHDVYLAKDFGQEGSTFEEIIANTVCWVLKERQRCWGQHVPKEM